jgi:hypothetical protein
MTVPYPGYRIVEEVCMTYKYIELSALMQDAHFFIM